MSLIIFFIFKTFPFKFPQNRNEFTTCPNSTNCNLLIALRLILDKNEFFNAYQTTFF